MNVITEVRKSHAASLNTASRLIADRKHSLTKNARQATNQERQAIESVAETFHLVNLTPKQLERIEFWRQWIVIYISAGGNTLKTEHVNKETGELVEFNPVRSALRYARSHENSRNRDNEQDVVNTCFLVFMESVGYGADENGNLIRKTTAHSNVALDKTPVTCDDGKTRQITSFGRDVASFRVYDSVDKLFMGCLNWSVANVLRKNSGSVDTRANAKDSYRDGYGKVELEQAMDKTGVMKPGDDKIRRDLSIGYSPTEIAKRNQMSQRSVYRGIDRLKTAAQIATHK